MDEKTFQQRKHCIAWKMSELDRVIFSLASLTCHVSDVAVAQVKFENRFKKASRVMSSMIFSLDGTGFPINEHTPFSTL